MSKYFVFGLPRSRTAWLSAFLSQSNTYCYHEAINNCLTEQEYISKIEGCGDSTTAFPWCPVDEYEGKPILIIEKSKDEFTHCIEWCDFTFNDDSKDILINQYDELMGIDGMRVQQSKIDESLPEIFEYLTGEEWRDRYAIMSALNIQADPKNINHSALEVYVNA